MTAMAESVYATTGTRNASVVPNAASAAPPSAGPITAPVDSIVLCATLQAVSSSGSRVSVGSMAPWAGQKSVPTTVFTIASPMIRNSGPVSAAQRQRPVMISARTASVAKSTRCFG